jgi:hypothetical protein
LQWQSHPILTYKILETKNNEIVEKPMPKDTKRFWFQEGETRLRTDFFSSIADSLLNGFQKLFQSGAIN